PLSKPFGGRRQHLSSAEHEVKTRSIGKRTEIFVACEQRNAFVQATLRNQGVAQAGTSLPREHLCSQCAGTMPISCPWIDERYSRERLHNSCGKFRFAKQFRKHGRDHHHLLIPKRFSQELGVFA